VLILTRKKGQSIMLDNEIEVIITAVEGEHIKIGINAPSNVRILRKEVYDAIESSNKEALQAKPNLDLLKKISKNRGK
jgi:carbon storage regulator